MIINIGLNRKESSRREKVHVFNREHTYTHAQQTEHIRRGGDRESGRGRGREREGGEGEKGGKGEVEG